MKPPFFGTKILEDVRLGDLTGLVNRDVLFASRWKFEKLSDEKGPPVFERLITMCEAKKIVEPRIVYGYFECRIQENALLVSSAGQSSKILRFEFPRQRQSPNLCVADFFAYGFVTMQLVTLGDKVIGEGARLFNEKKYSDAFYLKGLAAELTEAVAEYGDRYTHNELGLPNNQGCRFSFGYPAAPNLMDQEKLYLLLGGERIGVKLTETYHLVPEYSTSSIISFDPKAKLFRP